MIRRAFQHPSPTTDLTPATANVLDVDIFIIPYHPESATTLLGVYTRIAGGTFLTEEVGVNVPVFLAYYEETHFNGSGNYQAIEPVRSSDMLEDVKTMFLPDQGFE